MRRRLEALTDLAPLHQPKSLAALDAVQAALPDVPGVACFDTGTGDREIGSPDAPVRSLVISAREDLEIARQVRSVLGD